MRYLAISAILHWVLLIQLRINTPRIETVEVVIQHQIKRPPVKIGGRYITPNRGDIAPIRGDRETELKAAKTEMDNDNMLTRKDFVFSTYLERIKTVVEAPWIASVLLYAKKHVLPRGKVASVVWVILDANGTVVDVLIVKTSGDNFLDNLAILSIKGKVFPNPPKDLLDKDGFGRLLWTYKIR